MLLLVLASVGLALWLLLSWSKMRPKNFPPGPPCLPVVGSALSLAGAKPHLRMEEWRAQYGPLVGLVLPGGVPAVAVCGADAVVETLRGDDFQGRPDDPDIRERTLNQRLGMIFNDGPVWVQQRRFTLRHLRDFGFGKLSMEGRILEEVEDLLRSISNNTVEVTELFPVHMVNILWAITAGARYEREDARLRQLIDGVQRTFRSGNPTGATLGRIFPVLRRLAPKLVGYANEVQSRKDLYAFIKEAIHEHMKTLDEDNPRDFIDVYLREMKNSGDPSFTEDGLAAIVFDLFAAGSDTVSNTLAFAIMYMILYPEVQEKVHKELDAVVGRSRRISLEDRARLPYFEAVIAEISRINTTAHKHPCARHTLRSRTPLFRGTAYLRGRGSWSACGARCTTGSTGGTRRRSGRSGSSTGRRARSCGTRTSSASAWARARAWGCRWPRTTCSCSWAPSCRTSPSRCRLASPSPPRTACRGSRSFPGRSERTSPPDESHATHFTHAHLPFKHKVRVCAEK